MHEMKINVNALDDSENKTPTVGSSSKKQLFNKNSIRKQKRLCQMQKRLALFNEEDISELEIEDKERQNDHSNPINNNGNLKNKNLFQKKNLNINDVFNNSLKINLQKNTVNNNIENSSDKNENNENNENNEELTIDKNNSVYDDNDDEKNNTAKNFIQNDSTNDCIFADIVNLDSTDFKNVNIIDNFDDSQEKNVDILNSNDFEETPKTDLTNKNKNSNENQNSNNVIEDMKNDNNEEDDNVELNISNLELDINQFDSESNNNIQSDDFAVLNESSNEFAKKYLSTKSKSFIKFNNNLTARVAAQGQKSSPSYMLALCPELIENYDKKNMIRENYAVTDAISEEIESDTFTPRQSNNNKNTKEKIVNKCNNNSFSEEENELINIPDKKNATDKKYKKNNNPIFIQENPNKNNNKTKTTQTKISNNNNLNIKEPMSPNICNKGKISLSKNYSTSPSGSKFIGYYSGNAKSVNSIKQKLFTSNENIFKNNYINIGTKRDKTIYIKNSKIIIRHKKAKSLIFNNNLNTMSLYGNNSNMKSKPKSGASADKKKKSSIVKINNNNIKNKTHKVKILSNKDETDNRNKQKPKKYFSNDHFISSTINNTTKKKYTVFKEIKLFFHLNQNGL